jgi:long-chain acyl-CoA synthetase
MASHPEVPVAPLMDTIKQAVGFGPKLVAPASYAVVVDLGQPDKGIGPTYRSIEHKDQFVESYRQDVHTMWEAFSATVAATPDKPFHGTRELDVLTSEPGPFVFKTYAEVNVRVRAFGSGLVALGLMQQDADKRFKLLGIMGRNAPEWSCADFACLGYGGCTVPLYDSLKGEVLAHILNQNACATVVCDAPSASALIAVKPQVPALQTLVVYGPGADRVLSPLLQVLLFGKVEEVGAKSPASPIPPSASDVFSFVYTSGSTGFPKAALITWVAGRRGRRCLAQPRLAWG